MRRIYEAATIPTTKKKQQLRAQNCVYEAVNVKDVVEYYARWKKIRTRIACTTYDTKEAKNHLKTFLEAHTIEYQGL